MKYFKMGGGIDDDMVQRFIDFYNNNADEEIRIVLNTQGGGLYAGQVIIEMINSLPNATLIIQGAYSMGFRIAYETTCKKVLSSMARGMWHYGKWDINVNDKNKPYYYEDECIIKNMPIERSNIERVAKKIMTAPEYKSFLKDNNIYFDFKRMEQIFHDAKILK